MRNIPLAAVPNQSLTVTFGENRWSLRIKVANRSMMADVSLNDVPILTGQRIVPGTPIIPYAYLQANGNFLFLIDDEELPDWAAFDSTQSLVYATAEEMANGA